jgi:hypothetical protein
MPIWSPLYQWVEIMFVKRISGPRLVKLPDGSVMTRADLPDASTTRWVASRKAAVVKAVRHGLIHSDEALEMYGLSEEELTYWMEASEMHGEIGLKVTRLQQFRQS